MSPPQAENFGGYKNTPPPYLSRLFSKGGGILITNTPDEFGDTRKERKDVVEGSSGTSVAEETAYKSGGTSTGTYYTIFSCGKKGDTIVKLLADVLLVQ